MNDAVALDIRGIEGEPIVDWAVTYAAQCDRLFGLALIILRDGTDAADAVQAAFEKALRHSDQLRSGADPDAWLTRITCNEAISLARRRRVRRWVSFTDNEPVESQEGAIVDRMLVDEALGRLNPKHRAVVALHYLDGYGIDDISAILRIPRGTVASRLHHAREVLRTILARSRSDA